MRKDLIAYDWIPEGWCIGGNRSENVRMFIEELKDRRRKLTLETSISEIIDEHAPVSIELSLL